MKIQSNILLVTGFIALIKGTTIDKYIYMGTTEYRIDELIFSGYNDTLLYTTRLYCND